MAQQDGDVQQQPRDVREQQHQPQQDEDTRLKELLYRCASARRLEGSAAIGAAPQCFSCSCRHCLVCSNAFVTVDAHKAGLGAQSGCHVRSLKHATLRAETERLQLQQRAAELQRTGEAAAAAAEELRGELADAAGGRAELERRCDGLKAVCADLRARLAVAVREYKAGDIVAVGLRDRVARLTKQLAESQEARAVQVWPQPVAPSKFARGG